jgi:hypothetical protein
MKYLLEIERPSICGTWFERFLVEVQATSTHAAMEQIAFSLDEAERVVACVADQPDLREAA